MLNIDLTSSYEIEVDKDTDSALLADGPVFYHTFYRSEIKILNLQVDFTTQFKSTLSQLLSSHRIALPPPTVAAT